MQNARERAEVVQGRILGGRLPIDARRRDALHLHQGRREVRALDGDLREGEVRGGGALRAAALQDQQVSDVWKI